MLGFISADTRFNIYIINLMPCFFNCISSYIFQVVKQFFRITAFDKGYCQVGYRDFFQRRVQAGVSVDFVKIRHRNIVVGAFIFEQIPLSEYRGDVFLYSC